MWKPGVTSVTQEMLGKSDERYKCLWQGGRAGKVAVGFGKTVDKVIDVKILHETVMYLKVLIG